MHNVNGDVGWASTMLWKIACLVLRH